MEPEGERDREGCFIGFIQVYPLNVRINDMPFAFYGLIFLY